MNSPYFIEVLNRNGEVKQRQRISTLPIRIGRGYDNDFILDDRHASANHAIIEQGDDGNLNIRDLDSKNGVILKKRRQAQSKIDGNTVIRLGHTLLRIRSIDFPIDEALADTTLHHWEGWPPALSGVVLTIILAWTSTWFADTEKFEAIRYFTAAIGTLSAVLLWSGMWTLSNRLFTGQMRFGRHLFIAACGLVLAEIIELLCSVSAYAFSLEIFTRYDSHILMAITAGMVYFHLTTINPLHRKAFALAALLVSLLGSGLIMMINYQNKGYLADELYMGEVFSPALRISTDHTIDDFLTETRELKARVDVERTKAVNVSDENLD